MILLTSLAMHPNLEDNEKHADKKVIGSLVVYSSLQSIAELTVMLT
jgi:hypothetical protein